MTTRKLSALACVALLALACGSSVPESPAPQLGADSPEPNPAALIEPIRDGDTAALAELRTLAEQGDPIAQNALGVVYSDVPALQDPAEAVKWFRLAALQGFPIAQGALGSCYASARGVERDTQKAIQWLTLSAEQGHWLGQSTLGDLYRGQSGVAQDFVQTYKWYTIAASVLSTDGRADLEEAMLERRSRIAGEMTPAQIAQAEQLARQWTRKDWSELEPRLRDLG